MARGITRGAAQTTYTLADVAISWIAMVFISGLIIAGNAHGQDLVPAPPDFKPDVSPVIVTRPGRWSRRLKLARRHRVSRISAVRSNNASESRHRHRLRAGWRRCGRYGSRRGGTRAGSREAQGKEITSMFSTRSEQVLRQDATHSEALLTRTACRIALGLTLDDAFLDAELHAVDRSFEDGSDESQIESSPRGPAWLQRRATSAPSPS